MRISDWSSDVCSSDLNARRSVRRSPRHPRSATGRAAASALLLLRGGGVFGAFAAFTLLHPLAGDDIIDHLGDVGRMVAHAFQILGDEQQMRALGNMLRIFHHEGHQGDRKEHTSELQSLMRISYAVFCLKKKKKNN